MRRRVFVAVVSALAVAGCSQSIPQSIPSALEERPASSVGEFVVEVSVRQALPIPWAGWQSNPAFLPAALPVDEAVKVVLDELHAKWAEEKAAAEAEAARLKAEAEAQTNQVSDAGSSKGSSTAGSKGGSSGGSKASSGNISSSGGNTGGENTSGGSNPGGGSSGGGTQPVQVPCGIAPCQTAHVVTADDGAASQFCAAINAHRADNALGVFSCSVGKQSDAVAMANAGKTGGHGFTISTANGPGVGTLKNSPAHNNWMLRPDKTVANVGCAKRTFTVYGTLGGATNFSDMFCGARID